MVGVGSVPRLAYLFCLVSVQPCSTPPSPACSQHLAPTASPPSLCLHLQGVGDAKPYLRLQENCWALTINPDGEWRVSYDL